MVIGILQFELFIHGAESLKDKRRVVSSVKDKLHREHQVSVAEVALQDRMDVAHLGLAIVGNDGKYIGQQLDRITLRLRAITEAELGDVSREVLHDPHGMDDAPGADPHQADPQQADPQPNPSQVDPSLSLEMFREAQRLTQQPERETPR